MTTPRQQLILELADAVWDKPKGIEMVFKSPIQARNARFVFYRLRERLRKTASQEQLQRINCLCFTIEGSKVVVQRGSLGLTDFQVIDRETGENVSGQYEFIPELVNLSDEDFEQMLRKEETP